jgi:hypothetical protein
VLFSVVFGLAADRLPALVNLLYVLPVVALKPTKGRNEVEIYQFGKPLYR